VRARVLQAFASELEKVAAGLPLTRAAGYGALAGLGMHTGKKIVAAARGEPDPSDYGETAARASAQTAAGGAAAAALLNFLGRLRGKR
jgi:hypothetical protein